MNIMRSCVRSRGVTCYWNNPPAGGCSRSCREESGNLWGGMAQRNDVGRICVHGKAGTNSVKAQPSSSQPPLSVDAAFSSPQPSSAIDFLTLCRLLKTTKRKGWVIRGIKDAESVADHMYRMALMALIVNDIPGVDRERCVKMALVHDIAEAIVGDITPSDGIPKEEKSKRERKALDTICSMLGKGDKADEIKDIWNEYENNSSLEANLVKDFDKVELILQALEYENEHGQALDEFFESTAGKFQTDVGKAWAAEVLARRTIK